MDPSHEQISVWQGRGCFRAYPVCPSQACPDRPDPPCVQPHRARGIRAARPAQESAMTHKQNRRLAMAGVLLAVFAFGYVCGSLNVRLAMAQLPRVPVGNWWTGWRQFRRPKPTRLLDHGHGTKCQKPTEEPGYS